MKMCSVCKCNLDEQLFTKSSREKTGLSCACKGCQREQRLKRADSIKASKKKLKAKLIALHGGLTWESHGIKKDLYLSLKRLHGDACNICGIKASDISVNLCLDHDHNTSKVRGFLCHRCNSAIGLLRDSIENICRSVAYLTTPPLNKYNVYSKARNRGSWYASRKKIKKYN